MLNKKELFYPMRVKARRQTGTSEKNGENITDNLRLFTNTLDVPSKVNFCFKMQVLDIKSSV